MTEDTRTQIADANDESRQTIHEDDTKQICDLRESLEKHRLQNEKDFKKLMPLTELVEPMRTMIEERKAYTLVASKLLKAIAVVGSLIALVYGGIKLFKEFK